LVLALEHRAATQMALALLQFLERFLLDLGQVDQLAQPLRETTAGHAMASPHVPMQSSAIESMH
ncbi:hypothetical protein KSW98_11615, partial [Streptococcus pneumoniae]